jgi:hypothetical protein
MYIATEHFVDLADKKRRAYNAGDKYPADGVTVSEARLAELSSDGNRRKRPVIAAVADAEPQAAEPAEKPKAKRGRKKV